MKINFPGKRVLSVLNIPVIYHLRVHLWSNGFAMSQYGLTLLDLFFFAARFHADKMTSEETQQKINKGQVTCAP